MLYYSFHPAIWFKWPAAWPTTTLVIEDAADQPITIEAVNHEHRSDLEVTIPISYLPPNWVPREVTCHFECNDFESVRIFSPKFLVFIDTGRRWSEVQIFSRWMVAVSEV